MRVPVKDNKPAFHKQLRRIGLSLGLVTCILMLVGYVRIRPVLKNYALVSAIRSDDLMAAHTAVRQGANVNAWVVEDETIDIFNALGGRHWTAKHYEPTPLLSLAAASGHIDMMRLLISQGADVNVNDGGDTPLMMAIVFHQTDAVRCLVSSGADVNVFRPFYDKPMLTLARHQPEIRRILIDAGAHD